MEMQQVRYFLALCREGNFTRAAERCDVTQPSLTNAIRRLEQELGGRLFDRGAQQSRLTALGRAVKPHLELLQKCADRARRAAANFLTRDGARRASRKTPASSGVRHSPRYAPRSPNGGPDASIRRSTPPQA